MRVLAELEHIFDRLESRKKISGVEVDIFIPAYRIAIEYDGHYYHQNLERDIQKNATLSKGDITLIRVRENPLQKISDHDVLVSAKDLEKIDIDTILGSIGKLVDKKILTKIKRYKSKEIFQNEKGFKKYLSYFPSPLPDNSLEKTHPKLSLEWHKTLNTPLTPKNFTYGSGEKVNWMCKNGHEYVARIADRASMKNPTGCPFCTGKRVCNENSLSDRRPALSIEWHPSKNETKTPHDYTCGSKKKVWWLCPLGHEYQAGIHTRARAEKPTGCPFCDGKKVSKERSLAVLSPVISKEWHPEKNGKLTPSDFTHRSSRKMWWQCEMGHEYQALIKSRTGKQKVGCPYCSGQRVNRENNLSAQFPLIAAEWHRTKNENKKPEDFTSGSNQKVWWMCPKGHSYYSAIKGRTKKTQPHGCSVCAGKQVGKENSLKINFPDVSKEWHPTKNGEKTPADFTYGSGKKVWWLCSKNTKHEWEASIGSRTSLRRRCPFCAGVRKINSGS